MLRHVGWKSPWHHLRQSPRSAASYAVFLPLLAILVLGSGLRIQGIANSQQLRNEGTPFTDDAFYYFALGRNLAHGQPRVDALNPTTGFQPMWGFLVALPYVVAPEHGIAGVQMLGILLGAATCILIYWLTLHLSRSIWLAAINAGLWFFAPQTLLHNLGGMETSLAVLFGLLILACFVRYAEDRTRRRLMWLGLVSGLGLLARVDLALLVGWMIPVTLVFLPASEMSRIKAAIWWGVWAAIPLIPWVLFTLALGKSPLPESGAAVRTIMSVLGEVHPAEITWQNLTTPDPIFGVHYNYYVNNVEMLLKDFARQVYVLRPYWTDSLGAGAAFAALVALIGLAGLGAWLSKQRALLLAVGIFLLWAVSMIFAYALYVLTQWYFWRYMLPLSEVLAVLLLVIWSKVLSERSPHVRNTMLAVVIVSTLGLLVVDWQDYEYSPSYSWVLDGGQHVPDDAFEAAVDWINDHLDSEVRVGAFNSGFIGYYAKAPVINLDGKVNAEAHAAMEARQMWRYVCETDIRYVVDWPIMVHYLLKQRSSEWDDANLREVIAFPSQSINPIFVYEVNRARCP